MKILYITQFFPPELNGGATRVDELARIWARQGHDVTVSTCVPCHPTGQVPEAYRGKERTEETLNGVCIRWTPVYATPNKGFGKRIANHLSFMFWAVVRNWGKVSSYDVVIATSPPLFVAVAGFVLGLRGRVPYIFEVRDIWPKQAVDLGALKNPLAIRLIENLEMFLYRRAAGVVCVTEGSRDILVRRGVAADKVSVIFNGVDCDDFGRAEPDRALWAEHGLEGKFVLSYIGTHGMSQGLDHVVEAADRLRDEEGIHFLFIGAGADKEKLVARSAQLGLDNITFLGTLPRERIAGIYAATDICLVSLKETDLFFHTIPSKMFEIMASGKPILLGASGEARRILERSGAGIAYEPESVEGLAESALCLFRDRDRLRRSGEQGEAFVRQHFHRQNLAGQYMTDVLQPALDGKS